MKKIWYSEWDETPISHWVGKRMMVHTPVLARDHDTNALASWQTKAKDLNGAGYSNPTYTLMVEEDGRIMFCPETSKNQIHCFGQNTKQFGIALMGDGTKDYATKEQIDSLEKIAKIMKSEAITYHRDFPRFNKKRNRWDFKSCPGDMVKMSIEHNEYLNGLVVRYPHHAQPLNLR